MEITLDIAFVRRVHEHEYKLALAEIRDVGVVQAHEQSQQRHDQAIASAPDVSTLACRAGCTWCCHFSVDVRAVEVFRILDHIEREFSPEQKARVFDEIRVNSAKMRDLDEMQRMTRNVKCPFLSEGRCSIYAARPQTCRNYHATSVVGCEQSYEQPDNLDIDPEFAPYVYQAGTSHADAFAAALRKAGFDSDVYELNGAFNAALADPTSRQHFEAKLAPFAQLQGRDIPGEFDELDAEE
jgi:Fe-S-cluster containining protein